MIGIGISPILKRSFSQFDSDAQAYFDQLTGTVPDSYKIAVNAFVLALKASGDWNHLVRCWIHAAPNQQNARVSVKNPSSTPITEINSTTWNANLGYTGNGSNMALDTNFNALSGDAAFVQNSHGFGVYTRTASNGNMNEVGLLDAVSAITIQSRLVTTTPYACSQSASDAYVSSSSQGFWQAKRTGAAAIELSLDGTQVDTGTNASQPLPNGTVYLLAINYLAGADFNFSSRQISFSYLSSGSINHSNMNTAFQALKTAIGF